MLKDIFYWILNMSIIGSLTGVIVLFIRRIKPLPRFFTYCLWVVPFIRLWVPFGVASRYSLMSLLSGFAAKTVSIKITDLPLTYTNSVRAAESYFPIVYKTNTLESLFNIASIVWISVAAVIIFVIILLYISAKKEVRHAEFYEENVYRVKGLMSAAVYGIFKPRIMIPADMAEESYKYVLLHERAHIKRRDNLLRCIAILTASIHWFNPLSWVFLKYFLQDMEITCDAKVIKRLDENERKKYAETLLKTAEGKVMYVSAFGGTGVKLRIKNILTYRKLTLASVLSFSILAAAVIIVLLTNAAS